MWGDLKGEVRLGHCSGDTRDLAGGAVGQDLLSSKHPMLVLPTVPPQLLVAEGLGQVTTLVGQPLELPCQASGSPVPAIQCVWGSGGQGWGWGGGGSTHTLGVGGDGV